MHVVAPVCADGRPLEFFALTFHPFEEGTPSKTLEYDESISLDMPHSHFPGPVLLNLSRWKKASRPLFEGTQAEFAAVFRHTAAQIGLGDLGMITPYQLRHAGAFWEYASSLRSLAEVQRRGRWRSPMSVRRYEKGGRLAEQLRKLPPHLRALAVACANSIADVPSGRRSPLVRP